MKWPLERWTEWERWAKKLERDGDGVPVRCYQICLVERLRKPSYLMVLCEGLHVGCSVAGNSSLGVVEVGCNKTISVFC